MNIFKRTLLNRCLFIEQITAIRYKIGGKPMIKMEVKKVLKADLLPYLKEINPSIEDLEAIISTATEIQDCDEFADIITDVSHITI